MDWTTFIIGVSFAVIPMMVFPKVKQSSQTSIVPFLIQLVLLYLFMAVRICYMRLVNTAMSH